MVAVAFLPLKTAGQSPQILGLTRSIKTDLTVDFEDYKILPGAKFQAFAQLFRDDDLEFSGTPLQYACFCPATILSI